MYDETKAIRGPLNNLDKSWALIESNFGDLYNDVKLKKDLVRSFSKFRKCYLAPIDDRYIFFVSRDARGTSDVVLFWDTVARHQSESRLFRFKFLIDDIRRDFDRVGYFNNLKLLRLRHRLYDLTCQIMGVRGFLQVEPIVHFDKCRCGTWFQSR